MRFRRSLTSDLFRYDDTIAEPPVRSLKRMAKRVVFAMLTKAAHPWAKGVKMQRWEPVRES